MPSLSISVGFLVNILFLLLGESTVDVISVCVILVQKLFVSEDAAIDNGVYDHCL